MLRGGQRSSLLLLGDPGVRSLQRQRAGWMLGTLWGAGPCTWCSCGAAARLLPARCWHVPAPPASWHSSPRPPQGLETSARCYLVACKAPFQLSSPYPGQNVSPVLGSAAALGAQCPAPDRAVKCCLRAVLVPWAELRRAMALQETPAPFPGELGSPGSQQPALW